MEQKPLTTSKTWFQAYDAGLKVQFRAKKSSKNPKKSKIIGFFAEITVIMAVKKAKLGLTGAEPSIRMGRGLSQALLWLGVKKLGV